MAHATEAVIVASCPQAHQEYVAAVCKASKFQKAFGKAGDMVDSLSGKDWVAKWEAKVVMATVTKAQTLDCRKALILCIAGGPFCDLEMARQPALVRAIKQEMQDESFRVRIEWMDIEEFQERFPALPRSQDPGGGVGPSSKGGNSSKGASLKGGACSKGKHGTVADSPMPATRVKGGSEGQGRGKGKHVFEQEQRQAEQTTVSNGRSKEDLQGKGSGKSKGKTRESDFVPARSPNTEKNVQRGSAKSHGSKGKSALLQHDEAEQCRFFAAGFCKRGSACSFAHVPVASTAGKAYCKGCDRAFVDEVALEQHWQSKIECKQASNDGFISIGASICRVCDKMFANDAAYHQHLKSSGHGEQIGRKMDMGDEIINDLRIRINGVEACEQGAPWVKVMPEALQKAKQLLNMSAGLVRILFAQSGRYGLDSSPEEMLYSLQHAVDLVHADFYELGKWLTERGAHMSFRNVFPDGQYVTAPCSCGETPMIGGEPPPEKLRHCRSCGSLLRALVYPTVTDVPKAMSNKVEDAHRKFRLAVAELGFPTFKSALFEAVCKEKCTCASIIPRGGPLAILAAAARHMEATVCGSHDAAADVTCEWCSRTFSTQQYLESHKDLVHGRIMSATISGF